MAVTWIISIPTGLIFGFLASRLPMPSKQFDDTPHFAHVHYGDNTGDYNAKVNPKEGVELTSH